jgi:hypothetical protein
MTKGNGTSTPIFTALSKLPISTSDSDQHSLRELLERRPIRLTVLDDDLLLVPVVSRVVIRNKIVRKFVAIRAEPAIQRPHLALLRLKPVAM